VGSHFELFRKMKAKIGPDIIGSLSIEERDEKLKHALMTSRKLHPALISPEAEYKVGYTWMLFPQTSSEGKEEMQANISG
jgi:hypothetical protein